ncbi:MAG: sugar phosphate isomerase/epimerase [Lysobacter sp.]|nr:sugar phosphate isomerase/epimerase [Lysobacter sp.]
MRLAISNIAWDVSEDEDVCELIHRYGIDAIDVAPSKYFSDPAKASDREVTRVRNWWSRRGIEITGMQSLLFGSRGMNVFSTASLQEEMLNYLSRVCRIGAGLGGTRLVFGSPRNRDRSGLTEQDANDIAAAFFRRLGNIAEAHGVLVCLEPTPARYGGNFMTTTAETAKVVGLVASSAIKMQMDTGSMALNGEDPIATLGRFADLIGHVHASEPDLLPLGDGITDHEKVHAALERYLPTQLVSIEMLATKNEPHLVSIERAIKVACEYYRAAEA